VSDITYIAIWPDEYTYTFCYLSLVLDAYTEEIVGWSVGESLSTRYPLEALNMALEYIREHGGNTDSLIHHSDRGCQYASHSTRREIVLADYKKHILICTDQFRHEASWRLVQKYRHGAEHCLTKNERDALRHDMNVCFADFYDILHQEGPRLSQTEKMVAVCYLLGFNAEESEELLGITDNYVRVSKSRLKKKLPPDFYDLIFLNTERTAVD